MIDERKKKKIVVGSKDALCPLSKTVKNLSVGCSSTGAELEKLII